MSYMAGSEPAPCAPEPSHAQSGSSGCDRPLLHLADGHPDPATDFTLRGCRASETVGEPDMRLERIISGGQTGADRAALDFAIAQRMPRGRWWAWVWNRRRRGDNWEGPRKRRLKLPT